MSGPFFSFFFSKSQSSVMDNQFSKCMKADRKSSVVLGLIDSLVAPIVELHAGLSQGAVGEDLLDKKMPG